MISRLTDQSWSHSAPVCGGCSLFDCLWKPITSLRKKKTNVILWLKNSPQETDCLYIFYLHIVFSQEWHSSRLIKDREQTTSVHMAALLTFYYFPSLLLSVTLSLSLFHPLPPFFFPDTLVACFLLSVTQMWARLRVTGERQWSRFDLDGSESEVTVIKGCSELLLAPGASINEWHETAVRCRDRQGRRNDGGQVTAAHTRPSPVMSSAGTRQKVWHRRPMCTHVYRLCKEVSEHTTTYKTLAVWGHSVKRVCLL